MKTPEEIQEYLKYITAQRENLVPESMKPKASVETLIAAAVSQEIESTLRRVLGQQTEPSKHFASAGVWGTARGGKT
jgi:hypothetical protein